MSLFKTLILIFVPNLISITNIEWLLVFLIIFWNISLLFSPLDGVCQMSAGSTGPAKAMVNNCGLSQIILMILNVENISKPLENNNIKSIYDITL